MKQFFYPLMLVCVCYVSNGQHILTTKTNLTDTVYIIQNSGGFYHYYLKSDNSKKDFVIAERKVKSIVPIEIKTDIDTTSIVKTKAIEPKTTTGFEQINQAGRLYNLSIITMIGTSLFGSMLLQDESSQAIGSVVIIVGSIAGLVTNITANNKLARAGR